MLSSDTVNEMDSDSDSLFPANFHSLLLESSDSLTPCFYFLVGPNHKQVHIKEQDLLRQSQVFRNIYQEKLDYVVVKSVEGEMNKGFISLPKVDPFTFKIFAKMIADRNVSQALNTLKLSVAQILDIVYISKAFDTKSVQNIIENWMKGFLEKTHGFFKSDEFYGLNARNLETMFASEWITMKEVNIYKRVTKWALKECRRLGMRRTYQNMREVLGGCLFQIRFPLMSTKDFLDVVCVQGVLKDEEKKAISDYIFKTADEWDEQVRNRLAMRVTELGFSAKKRDGPSSWPADFLMEDCTDACTCCKTNADSESERQYDCYPIRVDHTQRLTGVGFAGPIESDGYVLATVHPFVWINNEWKSCGVTVKETVEKVGHITRVQLDTPVIIKPLPDQPNNYSATIKYSLKRPQNIYEPVYFGQTERSKYLEIVERERDYMRMLDGGTYCTQLVELLYDKPDGSAKSGGDTIQKFRRAIQRFFSKKN